MTNVYDMCFVLQSQPDGSSILWDYCIENNMASPGSECLANLCIRSHTYSGTRVSYSDYSHSSRSDFNWQYSVSCCNGSPYLRSDVSKSGGKIWSSSTHISSTGEKLPTWTSLAEHCHYSVHDWGL